MRQILIGLGMTIMSTLAFLIAPLSYSPEPVINQTLVPDMPVIEAKADEPVKKVPSLLPGLLPICSCESTGSPNRTPRQFNEDGSVLRGVINPRDVGMCQINLDYHEEAAKRMGLDVMTEDGNIRYANHLYSTQGAAPWSWSAHCHGQY